jgi:carbonic anhydrase
MDARLHPSAAFGITLGDAHIIRNAGGSAREALRSLIISQTLLGTEEILVVKHSDCGMVTFSGEDLFEKLGGESREVVEGWLEFKEVREAVRADVEFLRESKLLKGTVSGWVYKVESGEVEMVV